MDSRKITNHPVASWFISSVTLVFVSLSVTRIVLNVTTLGEQKGRNEGLALQNQRLTEDLRLAQTRYNVAQVSRDKFISKKASELSAGYWESIAEVNMRYDKIIQENAGLKSTLAALSSAKRQQEAICKASRLQELSAAQNENSKQIAEAHRLVSEMSGRAGYNRAECEKEDENTFSNVCLQVSLAESRIRSQREKISSLEIYGERLSSQLMALKVTSDRTRLKPSLHRDRSPAGRISLEPSAGPIVNRTPSWRVTSSANTLIYHSVDLTSLWPISV